MREIAMRRTRAQGRDQCDKLNVAALGNVVPQLHVHVIARFRGDPAWPRAGLGRGAAAPYEAARARPARRRDAHPP